MSYASEKQRNNFIWGTFSLHGIGTNVRHPKASGIQMNNAAKIPPTDLCPDTQRKATYQAKMKIIAMKMMEQHKARNVRL
uniref:Uncharacterized protein n=1 Tax=Setaria italica TaxID=4555 RepID=K3ZYN3_SETIT